MIAQPVHSRKSRPSYYSPYSSSDSRTSTFRTKTSMDDDQLLGAWFHKFGSLLHMFRPAARPPQSLTTSSSCTAFCPELNFAVSITRLPSTTPSVLLLEQLYFVFSVYHRSSRLAPTICSRLVLAKDGQAGYFRSSPSEGRFVSTKLMYSSFSS